MDKIDIWISVEVPSQDSEKLMKNIKKLQNKINISNFLQIDENNLIKTYF